MSIPQYQYPQYQYPQYQYPQYQYDIPEPSAPPAYASVVPPQAYPALNQNAARTQVDIKPKAPQQQAAKPAAQPVIREFDPTRECPICLDELQVSPTDANGRVYSANPCNIGCGHFLHEFCLGEFLKAAPADKKVGHQCPECKKVINKDSITKIALPKLAQPGVAPEPAPVPNVPQGPGIGTQIGGALWNGLAAFTRLSINAAAAGWEALTAETPEMIQGRWASVLSRTTAVEERWKKLPNFYFKNEIELVKGACDSIRNIRRGSAKESHIAEGKTKELEDLTASFENNLERMKQEQNERINTLQKTLIASLGQ